MARLTKAQRAEREEAIATLRKWCPPGATVYTVLDHVARSGMSRAIRLVVPYTREDGSIDHVHPNWAAGRVLGLRHWRRHGREQDALVIGGCGMDMGFHLVYELAASIYRDGYACLGAGKCPSPYHVNHRDRIRCPGIGSGDHWKPCVKPWRGQEGKDWPTRTVSLVNEEDPSADPLTYTIPLACIVDAAGDPEGVCPTCNGLHEIDNPEGPERFDLIHKDGYALRHRWL